MEKDLKSYREFCKKNVLDICSESLEIFEHYCKVFQKTKKPTESIEETKNIVVSTEPKKKTKKPTVRNITPCTECSSRRKKCTGHLESGKCKFCTDNKLECILKEYVQKSNAFTSGSSNPNATLTPEKVLEIRKQLLKPVQFETMVGTCIKTKVQLADEYKIAKPTITKIKNGETWNKKELYPDGWVFPDGWKFAK